MKVLTLHQPHASLCVVINPATGLPWKTIETRSWATKYRGPLALHASARVPFNRLPRGVKWQSGGWAMWPVDADAQRGWTLQPEPTGIGGVWPLPIGAVVATCTLVDVVPIGGEHSFRSANWDGDEQELQDQTVCVVTDGSYDRPRICLDRPHERPCILDVSDQEPYGDFTPGRYAWLLVDVVPVEPPVPFRGGQGLTKTWEPA